MSMGFFYLFKKLLLLTQLNGYKIYLIFLVSLKHVSKKVQTLQVNLKHEYAVQKRSCLKRKLFQTFLNLTWIVEM